MHSADWITAAIALYEGKLVRYATGIVGDIERARDVVQDTFLRLCKEDPSRIGEYLAQWLFTVCRNRALDIRKKEARMSFVDEAELAVSAGATSRPFALLERKEAMDQVMRVLETLPENQREVVILKFQADLSYKEISAVTGLSVTNVGFLLHTALKTIRQRLAEESAAAGPNGQNLRRVL
jgi:RNA polymerase sigma-70 factor (ECF subfamily)